MSGTPQRYTVDASVFLNAFNSAETGHAVSSQFLAAARQRAVPIVVPSLLFPEVAATIVRMHGDVDLARSFAGTLRHWPQMVVIPLDDALSDGAVEAAVQHRLRGSDAAYVAVTIRFGTTLVTLDHEQATRASHAVPTYTPSEAISHFP